MGMHGCNFAIRMPHFKVFGLMINACALPFWVVTHRIFSACQSRSAAVGTHRIFSACQCRSAAVGVFTFVRVEFATTFRPEARGVSNVFLQVFRSLHLLACTQLSALALY